LCGFLFGAAGGGLVLGEVVLCSQFGFFLVALLGEIRFPAWAEVDVPTPELT